MMFGDRLDQLRRVPLLAVLRETGAQRDRYDKARWHTPKGAISITGMKFMNWHQGLGGGGAIDLTMHLNDLDFKRAVEWLQRHFSIAPYSEPPRLPRRLSLPLPDCSRVSSVPGGPSVAKILVADDNSNIQKMVGLALKDQGIDVVAVGNGKILEDGSVRKLDVKAGDRILFGKYSGTEVKVDGEDRLILREDDILGIIEK